MVGDGATHRLESVVDGGVRIDPRQLGVLVADAVEDKEPFDDLRRVLAGSHDRLNELGPLDVVCELRVLGQQVGCADNRR
jgi:hypothetical protein